MINEKLKEIRENAGMNKKEFSSYIGVKYTTYNGYETGAREPDSDFLILISRKFDVSIDYMLGLQDDKEILHAYQLKAFEYDHIKQYRCLDTHGKDLVDYILKAEYERCTTVPEIPQEATRIINYYYRLASAGSGQIVFDMPPTESIEIPDIPEYKHVDYALGVNGHSMEPVFNDGDILLVQMTEEIELGEIGIFIVDGQSYVKKLGDRELISLNKGYDNIELTSDSKCVGRVIASLPPS